MAIHRSVVVTVCREGIRVHGPTQLPDWAAFRAHADLVDRMLDRQYRLVRPAGHAQGKRDVLLPPEQAALATRLAEALRGKMLDVAGRPIDQSHVQELLQISRAECNRWTKDLRLATSGHLIMSRTPGTQIRHATYSPAIIDQLLRHPEMIEKWRSDEKEMRNCTQR